jgi:hypothetical protein
MRNQNYGSDMIALDERQAQLDAFETERQAYNMAMLAMPQQEQEPVEPQEMPQEPAPVEPLEMSVGGDASLKALLAQNTETLSDELPEEPPINTDPVGTAQKMLASLTQTKKSPASPTAKSIKKSAGKGGASTGKEMEMAYEPLSAARDLVPQLKETGSARSQMEALAKAYKLRAQAATQQAKGFMRDTMNAPTLDKPNLGRATLAAKRFNEGGEVSGGSSTGFVTGKPIEFSDSPYSPYSIDFVTAKPIKLPLYDTNDQGGGNPVTNPFSDLTQAQQAAYYAANPTMAGITQLGQKGFGLTSLGMLQNALVPGFVSEQAQIAMGIDPAAYQSARESFRSSEIADMNAAAEAAAAQSISDQSSAGSEAGGYGTGDTSGGFGEGQYNKGGLVRRANGGGVDKQAALPEPTFIESSPATRTFLNVLGGRREPLTEKDFTPSEHAAMLEVIRNSEARGKSPKGRVDYGDYPSAENAGPGYKDIRNTLGGFGYQRDPEGGVTILDKYDFHGPRVTEYERMGGLEKAASTAKNALLEFLKQGGPRDLVGEIGRAYIGTKGPEVKIRIAPPVKRAKGSSKEGETAPPELTQEEIDAASKPAFVTPKSGKGRKEGPISQALNSGEAYVNMAKGLTEMPYNLAGAPVDLATMVMRPFGYGTEKPVMGSEYLKQKATELGIRQAPPTDPTAKGFYTAGDLLSNLVNPASVPRKVGPAIEKGVKAGATEVGRQLDRAIMDNAGPLAGAVPDAARPMYAVRPTGSMTSMGNFAAGSQLDKIIANGRNGEGVEVATDGIKNFWDVKARNYFEKQFGTPDDPIADALKAGRIKSEAVQATDAFPSYLVDQLSVGKTRRREGERPEAGFVGPGAPATRFFPKYPQAMEEFTSRYDAATGLKGDVVTTAPGMGHHNYPNMLSPLGDKRLTEAKDTAREMLAAQGVRDELANPNIELTARSEKDPTVSTGYSSQAKALLQAYEKSKEKPSMLSRLGLASETKPEEMLSQSVVTAIEKGEPIYDTSGIKAPLRSLFDPSKINKYLTTLPERELKKVRFEDVVQGANKMFAEEDAYRALADRIRNGKNVPDKVFSDGVSSPLLQFDKKSGYNGYSWKRLETPESTVPEGAYLGHSVGGYKLGGVTYSKEKMQDFKDGRYQVYTLRDNRNRPVTTVEVQMIDDYTPAVMQIKGNGRASGNTAPEDYDYLVLEFFDKYLHPAQISEKDAYLTPLLQRYKDGINATFKMP